VIASGGGGTPQHCIEAVTTGGAEAALVASMVHYGDCTVGDIKRAMAAGGVAVRPAA
jgi:cyclase